MNDNEKKSGDWKMIIGGILLIIVLFAAVKFIFWGLGEVISKPPADLSQNASASVIIPDVNQNELDAPVFCVHCGKGLPDSFEWGQFCPWCGEKMEGGN